MIRTDTEVSAIRAATKALGEALRHTGFDRPPATWSPGEAQAITATVVDAFRKEFWRLSDTGVPF